MAVYGIDFGTCYSCIAVADQGGSISVVPSARGGNTTPSVVMFNVNNPKHNGKPVVGETAKNAFTNPNPRNVVAFIKTELQNDETAESYQLTQTETRRLSPIEPVACIYHELFAQANRFRRGQQLDVADSAVITVPAVCSDVQREKTKAAAQLAGIKVLKVISEPTAAAISYNIGVGETVMVFDLGGGTLDVSIIRREADDDYKVLSTEGHATLGGKRWDEHLLRLCYEDLGLDYAPEYATARQLVAMEKYKIDLCVNGDATIDFVDHEGVPRQTSVMLEEFQQFTQGLVSQAMGVIDQSLAEARTADPNLTLSRVCLAGGSSKMPAIQQAIRAHLPQVPVDLSNPDQAIAQGAARYALALTTGAGHYDLNIDERGHAYGLLTRGANGKLMVRNIIQRSDPLEISGRTFHQYMPANADHLHITIIESDVAQPLFRYREQSAYFKGDVHFGRQMSIGQQIDFQLSRDADGIVHLSVGNQDQIQFATTASAISDELRQRVQALLQKMTA